MDKFAILKAVLEKTAAFVRQQQEKISGLEEKLVSYQKQEKAVKLASDMATKGLIASVEIPDKATELVLEEDLTPIELMIKHASKDSDLFSGTKSGPTGTRKSEQVLLDFTFGT